MPHRSRKSTTAEAYLLAGVGGCIDAIGLLALGGLFVSHMSGNTAALGELFGQGHWALGWPHLFAVPVFLIGLFIGYLFVVETPTYARCAWILTTEAVLLSVFWLSLILVGEQKINTPGFFLMATPPLLAMGMQNATLRQIGRSMFASTYVTGVLDLLAKFSAEYVLNRKKPEARAKLRDAISAAGVWLSYAVGAMLGGAGMLFVPHLILALPVAILAVLAVIFFCTDSRVTIAPEKII
jgi:uncharacterized membrane protein YoaK (UPF0700 family)